jgi:hypothetical protein
MKMLVAAGAVAALLALLFLPPAAGGPTEATQSVTLLVSRTYDNLIRTYKLKFAGVISSGAAGESVTVLQQTCGVSFATAIAGGETRSGGAWEAEPASSAAIAPSATYRARWGSVQSDPVVIKPEIPVRLFPIANGRLLANVSFWIVQQDMRGRVVALERKRGKTWSKVAQKRMQAGAGGFGGYGAVFRVPRTWRVRAHVPTKSAEPCFKQNRSEPARPR